jgi:adenylylsulfate reductase subunit A
MLDIDEGFGPLYMETHEAIQKIANAYKDDQKAFKKKMKELESEAWEDFLDMTISQAILWASQNVKPEEKHSEIAACEPYFIGSHSGGSGAWVSGPEDLDTPYKWGYAQMTTVDGLFAAGDASGASSHKFSSGSHTEGRIAGKAAVKFIVEKGAEPSIDDAKVEAAKARAVAPLDIYADHCSETTDPSVNTNYILPDQFMYRLQKIMDEYAGGVSAAFKTSKALLERAQELFVFLKEDSEKLGASNLHDLMRCWENIHRMSQGEAHIVTMLYREETRWPGYYFRSDTPKMDEENWKCFVNCRLNPDNNEWEMSKKDVWAVPGA